MFEIVVYKNQRLYYTQDVLDKMAIEVFLCICKFYINPECVSEQDGYFVNRKMFVSYSDTSGNDESKIVMLIGLITQDMIDDIKNGIKKFYIKNCEDYSKEIPITRVVCKECTNL